MSVSVFVWIVSSLAIVILALLGVRQGRHDLSALREVPRDGRYLIARHQLLRFTLRALAGLSWTFAGVTATLGETGWTIPLLIAGNGLVMVTTASDLATGAFLRRSVRQKLEDSGE